MTVSPSVSLRRSDAVDITLDLGGTPYRYLIMSDSVKMLKKGGGGGREKNIRAFFCLCDSQFLIDPNTSKSLRTSPSTVYKALVRN